MGSGIAVDSAGDLFVSAALVDASRDGIVVKRRRDGQVTTLATGLQSPGAIAFGSNGDLIVAEARAPGRVLRFHAPPPPVLMAPAFTNQMMLEVPGRAMPADLVQVFPKGGATDVLTAATADAEGAFTLQIPLAPNIGSRLPLAAVGARGAGLVGPRTTLDIVHDDHLPSLAILEPATGEHLRDVVVARARAEDGDSGVTSIAFRLDDDLVATIENPDPSAPLAAMATLDARSLVEGVHALTVAALDRAGNTAAIAHPLIVDRTAPDTHITSGPLGESSDTTAAFTVESVDVLSVVAEFSWQLDAGPWSAFSPQTSIVLRDVPPGAHRLQVIARDRAGNVDPTPAVYTFTVSTLRVRVLEPSRNAIVTGPTVWLRGVVEEANGGAAVTLALPPELRAVYRSDTLAVPSEAGMFAIELPIVPGASMFALTATDHQGSTVRHPFIVTADAASSDDRPHLYAYPAAGIAAHGVTFSMTVRDGVWFALDLETDGTVDYEDAVPPSRSFVYQRPGMYVATLSVTTGSGRLLSARAAVQVYDGITLNQRLQAVWRGFKDGLSDGAVGSAVEFIHSRRRAAWDGYFRQFTPEMFAATGSVFTDVTVTEIAPGMVQGEMLREVDGTMHSFPISFMVDVDGSWRLWQF
jgi:hypothetical protein